MEQVLGLTRRHGRVSERLRRAMSEIGLALAGRAGARLAQVMGIATSRTESTPCLSSFSAGNLAVSPTQVDTTTA
ncbi:hypothetical protein OHB54_03385 [Streptomyces sp. NBC_01007]|nr:hypothetical protein OHB54_03385 [Streptomyces sp. NBC_01007]